MAQEQPPAAAPPNKPPVPGGGNKVGLWVGLGVVAVAVVGGGAWWYMKATAKPPVVLKTYKVGLMTVEDAVPGSSTAIKRGVELSERLNKTDDVDVQIIAKETDCDPDAAAKAMKEFAAQGVVAVVGEFCSSATLGAAPTANSEHIPLISAASTSPKVTTAGDYVYRTIPSDTLESSFIASAMYNKYKVRKLAIMHASDDFGNGVRDTLKAALEKLGGKVVSDEQFTKNQTNFTAELTRSKASNPDAFFISSTYSNQEVLVAKRNLGYTAPLFGPDYFSDTSALTGSDSAEEGLVFAAINAGTQTFTEKFRAVYNAAPDTFAAQAYDATEAIIEGLKAGATNGATLKTQLDKVSFDGASGRIKFDANGDVAGNYTLLQVKGTKAIPVQ